MESQEMLNWITLALAAATVWLAFATQAMARASKRVVELEATPYLSFSQPRITLHKNMSNSDVPKVDQTIARLGIELRNPGKIRIQYKVKQIRMTLNSVTVENPEFKTEGGYIFPGELGIYWYGNVQFIGDLSIPMKGTAEFEIEYWAAEPNKPSVFRQKLEYSVLANDPPYIEWVNSLESHDT